MIKVYLSQTFFFSCFGLISVSLMEGFKSSRNKHIKLGSSSFKRIDGLLKNFWHLFIPAYAIKEFWCQIFGCEHFHKDKRILKPHLRCLTKDVISFYF